MGKWKRKGGGWITEHYVVQDSGLLETAVYLDRRDDGIDERRFVAHRLEPARVPAESGLAHPRVYLPRCVQQAEIVFHRFCGFGKM